MLKVSLLAIIVREELRNVKSESEEETTDGLWFWYFNLILCLIYLEIMYIAYMLKSGINLPIQLCFLTGQLCTQTESHTQFTPSVHWTQTSLAILVF